MKETSSEKHSTQYTEDDLKILPRILSIKTLTITCIIHLRDHALYAWTQVHSIRVRTATSCRDFRQFSLQFTRAPFNPHWPSGLSFLWTGTSTTTLVSVWNTRVFRMALTALTEPRTLWRRITCDPSPRRLVALHTYLLYFVVTYTHHQNDTCVTLFAGAEVMLEHFTQCLAMYMPFSGLVPHFTPPVIAIYRIPHSPHLCMVLRCCHLLQYSLRFGYIACRCICFAIIVFYRAEIYCPIFTLSSTMPSVLHILRCSIIG